MPYLTDTEYSDLKQKSGRAEYHYFQSPHEPILARYILAPQRSMEYHVPLYPEPGVKMADGRVITIALVIAVYRPTGRGPFRMPNMESIEGWEYEYQGVYVK